MMYESAEVMSDLPWSAGQEPATQAVQASTHPDLAEGLFYHSARSIEELDRAKASTGSAACQAHEQLAFLHLKEASRLKRNGLSDIVAEWVD